MQAIGRFFLLFINFVILVIVELFVGIFSLLGMKPSRRRYGYRR